MPEVSDTPTPRRVPVRESTSRFGVTGTYVAPLVPGTKYPVTSKTTSVWVPAVPTNVTHRTPPVPSGTVTPLARLSIAGKLTVDVVGAPEGLAGVTLT